MFKHLLCNKVEIQKISGYDSYNRPIIDEVKIIDGKLEFELRKVTNRNGDEVVSSGELRCLEELSIKDRINVQGVWREIINVVPQDDFSGVIQYWVVYF